MVLAAWLLGATAAHAGSQARDPLADKFGGSFTLRSADGRTIRDTDFRGGFMLIYFGYTHCPDICPTELSAMTSALEILGPTGDAVQPIFITVDPKRDTPEVLSQYQKSFHPRLLMLSGSELEIAAAAKAYKVHRRKYLWQDKTQTPLKDYGVDHSSLIYLMGPDGKFQTMFPLNTDPKRMAKVITKYVTKLSWQ